MASYSERDISLIPDLTFSFVENYIKSNTSSSGEKSINKGFKYFSEGYIHELRGSELSSVNGETNVTTANCTCLIGLSGACGHVTGMLYQLAKYKCLGQKALPEDIASTSLPQTWHAPRGLKIAGKSVQDIEVSGYSKTDMTEGTSMPKAVKSTLYNPVKVDPIDWHANHDSLAEAYPDVLVLSAIKDEPTMTSSKFGPVPYGLVLSYQQKLDSDFIMNIYDGIGFPDLPVKNVMENSLNVVPNMEQSVKIEGIKYKLC